MKLPKMEAKYRAHQPQRGFGASCVLGKGDKHAIAFVLGRVNVGTPDAEVRAEWERRADKAKLTGCLRKKVVAHALKCHHDNQREYNDVMRGTSRRRRTR
jgi:hypothetical protein